MGFILIKLAAYDSPCGIKINDIVIPAIISNFKSLNE